jgi:tRNA(fMet)-specific endonuclease VapC
MRMFVLDTNHITELTYRTAAGLRLLHALDAVDADAAVTAITVEESLRGWLAEIRRRTDPRTQIPAYQRLVRQVEVFASWLVLPWDDDAADHFDSLKALRQKVGTQDLKIACICLAHDATLLTRNLADFNSVPGLRVENWLD